jgi:hypothetical protein
MSTCKKTVHFAETLVMQHAQSIYTAQRIIIIENKFVMWNTG